MNISESRHILCRCFQANYQTTLHGEWKGAKVLQGLNSAIFTFCISVDSHGAGNLGVFIFHLPKRKDGRKERRERREKEKRQEEIEKERK